MFNLEQIRKDFPIFENYRKRFGKELIYLDSAASSQTPRQVIEAMDNYYTGYRSNVHRSPYTLGEEATLAYESARGAIAKFLNADSREIIFTHGATSGMNMLAYMLERELKLKAGDEILTTPTEHHSNIIPLQELARRTGATIRIMPLKETGLDYEESKKMLGPEIKILSLALASNVLGTVYDVNRLIKVARKNGTVSIVDATKAAGHTQMDVRSMDCDFLFFSGHKMMGPTGIGVLYGRAELLEKLEPSFFGGGMVDDVDESVASYTGIPHRFEPGTPNIAGAIGMGAAIAYLENIGLSNIETHSRELVSYAVEKLGGIDGVRIYSETAPEKNIGIVSFDVAGIHPHDVAHILGEAGVSIRGGHHCAMPLMKRLGVSALCRASFYLYNDKGDVDALVGGVLKAKKIFKA